MFTAITENNHQLHCSRFRKNDSMCEPLCLYQHGSSKSCNIAIYWWQCPSLPRPHQQPSSPQAPLLHVPSGCGQRFSSMLCLPQVGAFPLLLSYPCWLSHNLCNWHCSGLAMPSVPSPKENWLPHSDQSPCYAACVPSPRVPPTTAWLLSLTSTSGPPTLPLLHLLSQGR